MPCFRAKFIHFHLLFNDNPAPFGLTSLNSITEEFTEGFQRWLADFGPPICPQIRAHVCFALDNLIDFYDKDF
jgi:hypothetical protein